VRLVFGSICHSADGSWETMMKIRVGAAVVFAAAMLLGAPQHAYAQG